jgi:hypothetical protein
LGGAFCGHVTRGRSLFPWYPQLGGQKEGVACADGSAHCSHPEEAWTLAVRERERGGGGLDRSGNYQNRPKL